MRWILAILLPLGCTSESSVRLEVDAATGWCDQLCVTEIAADLLVGGAVAETKMAGCDGVVTFEGLEPGLVAQVRLQGKNGDGVVVVSAESAEVTLDVGKAIEDASFTVSNAGVVPTIDAVLGDDPECAGVAIRGSGFGDGSGDSSVRLDASDVNPTRWQPDFICVEGATPGDEVAVKSCGIRSRTLRTQNYRCLCAGGDVDLELPLPADGCTPEILSENTVGDSFNVTLGVSCGPRAALAMLHFGGQVCSPTPSFVWFDTPGAPLDLSSANETQVWAAMGEAGLRSHDLAMEGPGFDNVNATRVAASTDRQYILSTGFGGDTRILALRDGAMPTLLEPTQRPNVQFLDVSVTDQCIIAAGRDGAEGLLFVAPLNTPVFAEYVVPDCPGASRLATSDRWVATLCEDDASLVSVVSINDRCGFDVASQRLVRIEGATLTDVVMDGDVVVALGDQGLSAVDANTGVRSPNVALPAGATRVLGRWSDIIIVARTDAADGRGRARFLSRIREGTSCQ